MTDHATRKQIADQFKAVAHLAQQIADVHADMAQLWAERPEGPHLDLADMQGRYTAERMELLGDILNGMDAVLPEDAWTTPIFEEAQRRWPTRTPATNTADSGHPTPTTGAPEKSS